LWPGVARVPAGASGPERADSPVRAAAIMAPTRPTGFLRHMIQRVNLISVKVPSTVFTGVRAQ